VLLTALAACGSGGGSAAVKHQDGTTSFTVLESTPGFFDLPLHVAIDNYASKYHLKLDIQTVNGGGTLATEFQGGTGTVAMVGVDTPFHLQASNGVAGGVSIIGTNMTHMLYALVAKKDSKFTDLKSLAGQSVAVTGAGSASQVVLQWALNQIGMKPTDVKIVPLGSPPTILAGVQKGSVKAGTIFSPALEQGLDNGSVKMVYDFRKNAYAQNVFMARTKELKADPSVYANFMKAYNDAINKLESDPTYAFQAAKKA
jgi:ABC-type nitrate/sulfonate/bicarbonate transport system substrate-binding protein